MPSHIKNYNIYFWGDFLRFLYKKYIFDAVKAQSTARYTVLLVKGQCLKKSDRYSEGTNNQGPSSSGEMFKIACLSWSPLIFTSQKYIFLYKNLKNHPKNICYNF